MAAVFRDRRDAGRFLAARLGAYAGRDDVVVLGLPRDMAPAAGVISTARNDDGRAPAAARAAR